MKRYIPLMLAAMIAAASCEKAESEQLVDGGTMCFTVQYPGVTKAGVDGFESGDRIGVYVADAGAPLQISGNQANNVATSFDGTEWNSERRILWGDGAADVYAYYPYMEPVSINEHLFSVTLDQSTARTVEALGGYEASDFLWAKTAGATQAGGAVNLAFKHCCSRFVIELVKGADYKGEFPDNAEVFIHNLVPTATVDFTTGAVTKYLFGEPATIKAHKIDNAHYEAVVVPQRLDSRRPFVELVSNGVSYLLEDSFNFRAGRCYTLRLTINSNPGQVSVDIGGSVEGGWGN